LDSTIQTLDSYGNSKLCNPDYLESVCEEPWAETAGRLKIEYLFSMSFPLVGNPSPKAFGYRKKILDKPE